jgi:hypothetical protein
MDADPDFQEKCLKLMAEQVKAGEASGKDFAYLTDRVLRARGKPQRYGTQLKSGPNGQLEVQPCEDPDALDSRRASVGLSSIADYILYASRVNDPKQREQVDLLLNGWPEVRQGTDGSFVLSAKQAKLLGTKAAYEEATNSIGYWVDPADQVGWIIDIRERGTYTLSLTYACDQASEGSQVEISVAGESKLFNVTSTGSWQTFKEVALDTVSLVTPGLAQVRVSVRSMPKGAVMNLREIKLVRK